MTVAPWTTLSSRVAIASGRCLPSAFGMYVRREGRGRYAPRWTGPRRSASASPTAAPQGLNNAAPSVRLHYRAAELLRCYCSAPVPIGTRPSGDLPLGSLPSHQGDRFPRSVQEPGSESRRLHAGCHLGRNQDSSDDKKCRIARGPRGHEINAFLSLLY
jgi:hypothetical protein